MKIKAIRPFTMGSGFYPAGTVMEFNDYRDKRLVADGFAEPVGDGQKAQTPPPEAPTKAEAEKPKAEGPEKQKKPARRKK